MPELEKVAGTGKISAILDWIALAEGAGREIWRVAVGNPGAGSAIVGQVLT
jgi:hypothetical protein